LKRKIGSGSARSAADPGGSFNTDGDASSGSTVPVDTAGGAGGGASDAQGGFMAGRGSSPRALCCSLMPTATRDEKGDW